MKKTAFFIISVLILVIEFRSDQTWQSLRDVVSARIRSRCARLFVRLRVRANGARRRHYQKSLLHDNDRAVFRAKLVIIFAYWIALLRRLLICYNVSFGRRTKFWNPGILYPLNS